MKYLLGVFLFVSLACASDRYVERKKSKILTCIEVSDRDGRITCGASGGYFFINKHRAVLQSPVGSFDLKIVSRNSERWIGEDKWKNDYVITFFGIDDHIGIQVAPKDVEKDLLQFRLIRFNICDL